MIWESASLQTSPYKDPQRLNKAFSETKGFGNEEIVVRLNDLYLKALCVDIALF